MKYVHLIDLLTTSRVQQILEGFILSLLTLIIYLFTINPITRPFAIYALGACLLLIALFYVFQVKRNKKSTSSIEIRTFKVLVFALTTGILLWVGSTGWFFSPFFYFLYLAALCLAFLFSTSVAFSFIIVLIGVLLPHVGEVDTQLNIVSLLSLLLIIPLSYFLRMEYLRKIENEKKILILQEEHKAYQNMVEEVLANKITNVATLLREPINDVRQIASYAKKRGKLEQKNESLQKVIFASERALKKLKEFEEETTGKILVKTPRTS